MREVYSSSVNEIGYEPATKKLFVRWQRTGKMSVYDGVPEDVAVRVMNAPSIGQALREGVLGAYEHSYLVEE